MSFTWLYPYKNIEHFQNVMWVSDKTNGEVVPNMSKSIVIGHYNGI